MYQVVPYDPGGVTGWAVFQVHDIAMRDPGYKILENIAYWTAGQFSGEENSQVDEMVELAEQWDEATLVVESFILRQFSMDPALLSPVRISAAFDWAVRPRRVMYQAPSLAMTSVTDDRLRDWGFWNPLIGQEHARAAVKHGITWLRAEKNRRMNRFLNGRVRAGT